MRTLLLIATLLNLTSCGNTPCGCPFGTVCQPDYSKPEMYRCVPVAQEREGSE